MMKINLTTKAGKYFLPFMMTLIGIFASGQTRTFVHPGGNNNKADLDFVKARLANNEEPWKSAFNKMLPWAIATSNTTAPTSENGQKADAQKAYANALAWYYTGNTTYAQNAIGIFNLWATTFPGYNVIAGQSNQDLLVAGWIGALLGPAAEIMRSYSGWSAQDQTQMVNMFKTKFYPALNQMSTWNGNVDLTQIDAMMNIAVFCEDETEFNLGLTRLSQRNPAYFYLASDGGVPRIGGDYGGNLQAFWSSPQIWVDGLTQETCRDNGHHAQYALASALHAAEVAWNQGVDVYEENKERYVAALELLAKQINSGAMQGTCSNNISSTDIYNTWEVGYNHYHGRKGIELPNTLALINAKSRSQGWSDWNIFFETLTHANVSSIVTGNKIAYDLSDKIQIYPNPFQSTATIKFIGNFHYRILSLTGEVISTGSGENEIELQDALSSGIYLVTIISESGNVYVKKIIKN